jgi:hypothetical protein
MRPVLGAHHHGFLQAYGINGTSEQPSDLLQDLAGFLLTRSPYSWLGWGWGQSPQSRATGGPPGGCNRTYTFPAEFNEDYGVPQAGDGLTRSPSHRAGAITCL